MTQQTGTWEVVAAGIPRPTLTDAIEAQVVYLVGRPPDVGSVFPDEVVWAERRRAAGPAIEALCHLVEQRMAKLPSLSPVRALDQVRGEALGLAERFNR